MDLLKRMIREHLGTRVGKIAAMFLIAAVIAATPYAFSFLGKWLVDEALQVTGPPKATAADGREQATDAQKAEAAAPEERNANEAAPSAVAIEWKAKTKEEKLRLLLIFFVVTISVHILVTVLSVLSEIMKSRMVHRMVYDLRTSLHHKIEGMDLGFFSREQVGQFMSRVLDDAGGIPGNLTQLVINFLTQTAMLILGLVLLMRLNPKMSLVVIGALPFYAITCRIFLPRIRRNTEKIRKNAAELNGLVVERITNISTIKNYSQEDREIQSFGGRVDKNLGLSRRNHWLNLIFGTLTTVITGLATLFVLYLGFLNIKAQKMQLGEVLAFYQVTAQLFVPISALVGLTTVTQALQVLGQRVYSILDTPSELADAPDAVTLEEVDGKIAFEHVSLQYEEGGPFAVSDVSIEIPAGSTVCVVGPTGCGKSTLLILLTRLYDPQSGCVKLDDLDIRRIAVRSLRQTVGNVLNDCQVFSGTIAENIAFAAPGTPLEDIEAAARAVGLHDYIQSLDHGYKTRVGKGGVELATEELVKLAFARALVTRPAVLTVDDTYSAIDEETEKMLRAAVREVLRQKTVLVTTSRLSMCPDSDMVVVMERGTVAQTGTHDELLAVPGLYRRMYMRQMGMEEIEQADAERETDGRE